MLYILITICGYVLISVIYFTKSTKKHPLVSHDVSHDASAWSEKCTCLHENISYDFCYRPSKKNYMQVGLPFSCEYVTHLKNLGLLPNKQVIDLETEEMPNPVFVTAMSQNHYREGLGLIANIRRIWTSERVLVYDLGLTEKSVNVIKSDFLVELRGFPFKRYPIFIAELMEYRWKPIVIAMALKEFDAIWYMDTSVRWQEDFRESFYKEFKCRKEKRTLLFHLRSMLFGYCNKMSYLLHIPTRHSIYAATDPRLYDYFPTDIEAVKKDTCYCAAFTFVVKTTESIEILKWYVLCALEKECMGPSGANHTCTFEKDDRFTKHANCHRYDQSVVNILLANLYEHKPDRYVVTQSGGVEQWRLMKNIYGKEFWHITRNI